MTGSGGWPMSVFLTPDLRPFFAGTYFPPVRRYNMPSFKMESNLNIPFEQLKAKMTDGDSLGKAVRELNPNLSQKDAKAAVKQGKKEAKNDIKAANP